MEKKEMLYEGKAKKVYATDVEDVCIVDYKDDATAFNGETFFFRSLRRPVFQLILWRSSVTVRPQ